MALTKTFPKWLFLVLTITAAFSPTNSRFLKHDQSDNDFLLQKMEATTLEEDDVDLEAISNDYYDSLWQYFDSIIRETESKKKNERKWEDKDYMSDMALPEPEINGENFKPAGGDSVAIEKKNLTWPNNSGSGSNGSNGESDLPDALRAYRESNSQEEIPLRIKEMRLKSIVDQILKFRGGSSKPNETIPNSKQFNVLREMYEKNINKVKSEEWSSSYSEKVQSFYPSCDIPRNTDEDVWTDPYSMNLLFDLEYPTPQEDTTVMVAAAKLRLYKLPQENYSFPASDASSSDIKSEKTQTNIGILPGDEDKQIRVSVYWYTRSLRRHRVKKKLLDSQMLAFYAPKWVEFNIRSAVRTWKASGKNFGLVINVEDEDGVLLPVEQYIHAMNCSKWTATIRPIPSILMDPTNEYFIENSENKNETIEDNKNDEDKPKICNYQPFLFPVIDLSTAEVPNADVKHMALVNSAKKPVDSKFINLSKKGLNGNDSIFVFLKKNNLDLKDISRLSRIDKSTSRKSELKNGEPKISYFQNVPIGSPSASQNGNTSMSTKRIREPQDMSGRK